MLNQVENVHECTCFMTREKNFGLTQGQAFNKLTYKQWFKVTSNCPCYIFSKIFFFFLSFNYMFSNLLILFNYTLSNLLIHFA